MNLIGAPLDRVDGRLKVTGGARYSAEFRVAGLAYAVMVTSTVAKGRIASIDTRDALRPRGVLAVLTHHNAPHANQAPPPSPVATPVTSWAAPKR